MKSSLPNSLFGVSCELTRRLLSCRWNSPSIDESHRATQFLPQNKCRNLNSQCLGQQPTSAAGDGGYYYFGCAIIIFSSHCLPTFLTCLTWFPTALQMGWCTWSQNWARAGFTLFYLPASPDRWAGYLGVCIAWSARQNYPHHCWYKAAPSTME